VILDLTPNEIPAANGGEQSVASAEPTDRSKTDCSLLPSPAGGGNVRASRLSEIRRQKLEVRTSIIDAARIVVIKELIALHGNDVPSVEKFRRYLDTLTLSDLCARRDQFLRERQEQLDREERSRNPELFDV
jgi:hypothetical protein